jgi:hypothetical protein
MKYRYLTILLAIVSALVAVPHSALAASEQISNLTINAVLTKPDVLNVTEHIVYDFDGNPHAVVHDIPLIYQDDQGTQYNIGFHLLGNGVKQASNKALVRLTMLPNGESSIQDFTLHYTLGPVVLNGESGDVLKFSATGLGWSVPVNNLTLTLVTPKPAGTLTCYTGTAGITTGNCQNSQSGDTSIITTDAVLPSGSGLTVYCNFPSHTFSSYLSPAGQGEAWIIVVGVLLGLIIIVALTAYYLARRRVNKLAKDKE